MFLFNWSAILNNTLFMYSSFGTDLFRSCCCCQVWNFVIFWWCVDHEEVSANLLSVRCSTCAVFHRIWSSCYQTFNYNSYTHIRKHTNNEVTKSWIDVFRGQDVKTIQFSHIKSFSWSGNRRTGGAGPMPENCQSQEASDLVLVVMAGTMRTVAAWRTMRQWQSEVWSKVGLWDVGRWGTVTLYINL